jgi:hypothetical protein
MLEVGTSKEEREKEEKKKKTWKFMYQGHRSHTVVERL